MIATHKCPQCPDAIFIHPGAEPAALAGNATIALEIVEELPDVDCIVVPYGSGSVCTGVACGIRELAKEQANEQVSITIENSENVSKYQKEILPSTKKNWIFSLHFTVNFSEYL